LYGGRKYRITTCSAGFSALVPLSVRRDPIPP
jgi:hypothetical protein